MNDDDFRFRVLDNISHLWDRMCMQYRNVETSRSLRKYQLVGKDGEAERTHVAH